MPIGREVRRDDAIGNVRDGGEEGIQLNALPTEVVNRSALIVVLQSARRDVEGLFVFIGADNQRAFRRRELRGLEKGLVDMIGHTVYVQRVHVGHAGLRGTGAAGKPEDSS